MKRTSGVVMACMALAGCSGSGGDVDEAVPRALTEQEREVISDAEGLLTQQCMEAEGFEIFLTEPPAQGEDLLYGRDDVEEARADGLGLAEAISEEERNYSQNGRYFESLSGAEQEDYLEALNGDVKDSVSVQVPGGQEVSASTQGCTAAAQDELYGDFEEWFTTSTQAEALPQQRRAQVVKDDRYRQAEDAWAKCMSEQGHDVASPAELRATMIDSADPDSESEAAVAEARCGAETNLPEVGAQVEADVLDRADDGERRLVEHYRTLSHAALERGERVVADAQG